METILLCTSMNNLVVGVQVAQALEDRDGDKSNDIHGESAVLCADTIQGTMYIYITRKKTIGQ